MKSITASELRERLKKKDFILLDVRSKPEFDDFHIPGSILIPYDQLERRHKELDAKKDSRIICICRSGHRSGIACDILEELGYRDVTNVEGGLLDY